MEDFTIFLKNFECDLLANTRITQKEKHSHEKLKKARMKRGGYRPVLVDESSLKNESTLLGDQMKVLNNKNLMSDQDMVAFYILVYLNQRYPNHLIQSFNKIEETAFNKSIEFEKVLRLKNKNVITRLKKMNMNTLFDLVNSFNLHSVPHSARFTLVKWYTNANFNLKLFVNEIPTSNYVLEMQANRQRCVSLIFNKIDELIMDERDPLSFLLHDLVHAYKMFSNQVLFQSQVGFYKLILKLTKNLNFNSWLNDLKSRNKQFGQNFDYLISDMNSHAKHLFFYFKTILIIAIKTEYKIETNQRINGAALNEFNRIFESILEIFEMSETEKVSARSILLDDNLEDNNSFNCFDFTLLNEFFNKISIT